MLESISIELHENAKRLGFEIRCVGGLLKFYPLDVPTKVLLALDESDDPESMRRLRIWQHRNDSLTRSYKGRVVTKDWVLGFMEANSETAAAYTSRAREQEVERESTRARKSAIANERCKRDSAAKPKKRRIPGSSRLCPECQGQYSFVTGNEDEDKHIVHCANCEGGYLFDYQYLTDEQYADLVSQQLEQYRGGDKE